MSEKTELKGTSNKFYAVGKVRANKKNGFVIDATSKNNDSYIYSSATLHLDCGKERLSFAQLMGGYDIHEPLSIRVHGKDASGKDDFNKRFDIDWEDRFDKDTLESVGNNNFIIVGLETYEDNAGNSKVLYKRFLSAYDAIPYVQEHLKEDSVIKINGDLRFSDYEGKTNISKNITYIALSNVKEEDFYATFRLKLLVDKESLGDKDEDGLVSLSGYVIDWHKPAKGNIAMPYTIFIDPSKYSKWDNIAKKFKPKKENEIWLWGIEGSYVIQSETIETTVDDLPDDLKEMVEDGMISEEEAVARVVGGNKSKEIALFNSFQTKKNADGVDEYDKETDLYTTEDLIFAKDFDKKGKSDKSKSTSKKKGETPKDPFAKTNKSKISGLDEDLEAFMNGLN